MWEVPSKELCFAQFAQNYISYSRLYAGMDCSLFADFKQS